MTLPDTALLGRFHQVLVEEIRNRRPEYLREPFTVAEIYQDLIPYNTHRDRLGVEMNGDYEDALLRLLAGEQGLLVLESEAARRELGTELRTPDPDTGLFRNYAAATVRLAEGSTESAAPGSAGSHGPVGSVSAEGPPADTGSTERAEAGEGERVAESDGAGERVAESDGGGGAPETAAGNDTGADSPAAAEGAFEGATPAEDPPAPGAEPTRAAERDEASACPWCRERLPGREDLRFCPFCGTSLEVVPCPECGEELERHWRFCVRCGTEAGG